MCGKDAPHHIFVDIGSKCFIDLLCDPWAAKPWIALFYFNNRLDKFGRWAFGAGFSFATS